MTIQRDSDRMGRMIAPNSGSATDPSDGDTHEYDPTVVEPGKSGFTAGFTKAPAGESESGSPQEESLGFDTEPR